MRNSAQRLAMAGKHEAQLRCWVGAPATPPKIVLRSHVCLLAHDGLSNSQIARELKTSRPTVLLWRKRFTRFGVAGLEHEPPRKPSRRRLAPALIKKVMAATLHTKPPAATRWSTRTLARHLGVSHMTVARIWDAQGLQPNRPGARTWRRNRQFREKLIDIVGHYVNPPEQVLVLCVYEKAQNQTGTENLLLRHDHVRYRTSELFAKLEALQGMVMGGCFERLRHEEFLTFLRWIDRETPQDRQLHLVIGNHRTRLHPKVESWLNNRHARFQLHFPLKQLTWLSWVKRWFAKNTRKRIRRGSFQNMNDLIKAIQDFSPHNDQNPKPFIWRSKSQSRLKGQPGEPLRFRKENGSSP
jgi:transposase